MAVEVMTPAKVLAVVDVETKYGAVCTPNEVREPLKRPVPATANVVPGVVVPMPTLPAPVIIILTPVLSLLLVVAKFIFASPLVSWFTYCTAIAAPAAPAALCPKLMPDQLLSVALVLTM